LATLLYCFDPDERLLLLKRHRPPNVGRWVPPGGKVEVSKGESPYACACREADEEAGLKILPKDLHLTGLISENGYEGSTHWYIFLFEIKPRLFKLPKACDEGEFNFLQQKKLKILIYPKLIGNKSGRYSRNIEVVFFQDTFSAWMVINLIGLSKNQYELNNNNYERANYY
jgi:8-oxo-dGTP diphosphatase